MALKNIEKLLYEVMTISGPKEIVMEYLDYTQDVKGNIISKNMIMKELCNDINTSFSFIYKYIQPKSFFTTQPVSIYHPNSYNINNSLVLFWKYILPFERGIAKSRYTSIKKIWSKLDNYPKELQQHISTSRYFYENKKYIFVSIGINFDIETINQYCKDCVHLCYEYNMCPCNYSIEEDYHKYIYSHDDQLAVDDEGYS
jgi:hypothetical protein